MRLIDAEQMAVDESEAYMSAQSQITNQILLEINQCVHEKIQRIIAETPIVDAMEVVRCKDCNHYAMWADGRAMNHCDKHDRTAYDDNFCSYGERRCE